LGRIYERKKHFSGAAQRLHAANEGVHVSLMAGARGDGGQLPRRKWLKCARLDKKREIVPSRYAFTASFVVVVVVVVYMRKAHLLLSKEANGKISTANMAETETETRAHLSVRPSVHAGSPSPSPWLWHLSSIHHALTSTNLYVSLSLICQQISPLLIGENNERVVRSERADLPPRFVQLLSAARDMTSIPPNPTSLPSPR